MYESLKSRADRADELLAMLRQLEWSRPVRGIGDTCPVCGGIPDDGGHSIGCRLHKLLEEGK